MRYCTTCLLLRRGRGYPIKNSQRLCPPTVIDRRYSSGVELVHVFQGGFDEPSIEIWSGGGTCVCRDSSLRATECAASSEGIRNGARSTVRFGDEFSETAAELVSRRRHRRGAKFEGARFRLHPERRNAPVRVRSEWKLRPRDRPESIRFRDGARGPCRFAGQHLGRR